MLGYGLVEVPSQARRTTENCYSLAGLGNREGIRIQYILRSGSRSTKKKPTSVVVVDPDPAGFGSMIRIQKIIPDPGQIQHEFEVKLKLIKFDIFSTHMLNLKI